MVICFTKNFGLLSKYSANSKTQTYMPSLYMSNKCKSNNAYMSISVHYTELKIPK